MGPPVVALVVVGISTTKIYQGTTKTLKNFSKHEKVLKLFSVTSALQKFIMQLCLVMIHSYKKLLLINWTFTRMLQNKCLTSLAKYQKLNQNTQHRDSMQRLLPSELCIKQDLQKSQRQLIKTQYQEKK